MVFGRSFVVQIENLQLVQDYLGAKLIDKRHVHLLLLSSSSSTSTPTLNLRVVLRLHQFRLRLRLFGKCHEEIFWKFLSRGLMKPHVCPGPPAFVGTHSVVIWSTFDLDSVHSYSSLKRSASFPYDWWKHRKIPSWLWWYGKRNPSL